MIISTFSLFFLQRQEVLEILQYFMYLFLPYILLISRTVKHLWIFVPCCRCTSVFPSAT